MNPCRGGEAILRRLFEPIGYDVRATTVPLDPQFPQWGDSRYLDVTFTGVCRLRDLLAHLFVLLPVLDDDKHYWVGTEEVDKLLRRGGDWLGVHPDRELIARRYLRHDRRLTSDALARLLAEDDDAADPDELVADGLRQLAPVRQRGFAFRYDALVAQGLTANPAPAGSRPRPASSRKRKYRARAWA